jgi:excisionase family DNA binding protein
VPTRRQLRAPDTRVAASESDAGHGSVRATGGLGARTDPRLLAPGPKLLLSPAGAASALSVSRSKVYRLLREGRLESVMLDGNRRITLASLQRLVDDLLDVAASRDNVRTPA